MASFLARLLGAQTRMPAPSADTKAARGALFALHALGQPRWTLRSGAELIREGYERRAVVYRCVRMIAENAASIPWLVYARGEEAPDHPLTRLLARPNASEACPVFLEGLFTDLMLFGDSYVQAASLEGAARALYRLRPDRMSVIAASNGWPRAYEYRVGADVVRYSMEEGGQTPILHLRCFHPLDDHYGFAPLAAAQTPLDVHNAADAWSKALLDNSARPSGALVYAGSAGALTEDQFERLKTELDENFSGARNAGRPLLLEGGLDWKPLSLSPKDMDFARAKHDSAREIALAFGVPPLLLGLPGDNTHANFQEANRAFWRQTIIPLVKRTQKSFEAWLAESFPGARIEADLDGLDALASERETEWRRLGAASFLSDDEKRAALGYGARDGQGQRAQPGAAPADAGEGGALITSNAISDDRAAE
jgi:HK97 family phage portal protein